MTIAFVGSKSWNGIAWIGLKRNVHKSSFVESVQMNITQKIPAAAKLFNRFTHVHANIEKKLRRYPR